MTGYIKASVFDVFFLSAALKSHKKIIKPHIITMRGFVDL